MHMAVRVIPSMLMSRSSVPGRSFVHRLKTGGYRSPQMVALVIALLMLGSCAEIGEFRTDIGRLRSDLQANTQTVAQLSARVDALERRQIEAESAARQTQQDLSQAIEVLLKRALVMEDRQSVRELARPQTRSDDAESRGHHPTPAPPVTSLRGGTTPSGKKQLSLGMTQDDVRRLLGEPLSIEPVGEYVFWHYSATGNQHYVIFERMSGQVSGWRDP
jgi:SmpA / OmlA family